MSRIVIYENILRMLITSAFPIALVFEMSRFRSRRKARAAMTAVFLAAGSVNVVLFLLAGHERMKQLYAVILFVPCILYLLAASKDWLSQHLFNFFTAVNAVYFVSILSHFITGGELKEGNGAVWQDAVVRGLLSLLILFLFARYLRSPYQFLAANMKKGSWRVFAVIPFCFFALVMFLGLYPHVRTDNLPAVTFLYVILCFVYYIIYQVYRSTYELLTLQRNAELLESQSLALMKQIEAVRTNERELAVYRHDMRHYLSNIIVQLREGKTKEALEVLKGRFDELDRPLHLSAYCKNPIVNATLALYLKRAEEAGIQVSVDCDIPEVLPVDSAELAIVLANAVENAVHACAKRPEDARKQIKVRCVSRPQMIVEVVNTYDGTVDFDENSLPRAEDDGHGTGTQSILAFARKYNAFLSYKTEGDMFYMRVLVNYD
ncbi:sensor histidine kinase [Dorea sp. D27]|uniref:sensor histidine kinase n=1 Tax=Dorea sp. D27 TaxID=658665 RepID=UPI00067360F4|nr:ATP-binding protein [Dorea sp. D27]KMZ54077.1 hypothetical protein HMPREF0980_01922 [Dorea sp. D27]